MPPVVATADDVAEAIVAAVERAEERGKPVLAAFVTGDGTPAALLRSPRRIASFPYPESAARALGRASDRADWLRRPAGVVPELDGLDVRAARAVVDGALRESRDTWLEPRQVRALLTAYGVPLVDELVARSPAEALDAAAELGFPVVVKTAAAGAHKTDVGGIALDLETPEQVVEAVARIGAPVLVQTMLRKSTELLAGVVQDPVFGPLVAFGPGGVFAELIGQAQFRIAPLTDIDAADLVQTGKAGALVRGFRGTPAADAAALADLLLRLSRLADDLPEVAELDLNPVLAFSDRCVAVDARVRVRPVELVTRAKTW